MSFLDDVDNSQLAEKHIRKIIGLEMEQGRNLAKEYEQARKFIKNRIFKAEPGSFTEAQSKILLLQIDQALKILKEKSDKEAFLGVQIASEQSINDLAKEISFFSKEFTGIETVIPIDVVLKSMDSETMLFNNFQASLDAYSQTIRDNLNRELTQAIITKIPYQMVVERLDEVLGLEEWRAARIARTELHNVYNASKVQGMGIAKERYVPGLKKALIHPMDARTGEDSKILASINPIVEIDEPFRYTYAGKERVFLYPPDRPNDRAILIPYSSDWER
jgi:hypothetical protein